MGADRGILVKTDGAVEPLAVAKILKAIVDAEKPGLVILGKQAIDDDCNQTGQMLAALLGWPQGTFASKLVIDGDTIAGDARGRRRLADRQAEGPAIVTTDLRLNEPRYASLPNIMKAKKKPIEEKTPDAYRRRRHAAPRSSEDRRAVRPQVRRQGRLVAELVDKLKRSGGHLMATLLLAEHDNKSLKDATSKALTAAQAAGRRRPRAGRRQRLQAVADAAAKLDGVAKVLLADAPPTSTGWPSRWPR